MMAVGYALIGAYPLLLMPVYEFRCRACGERFDELVAPSEVPPCPACGAKEPERVFSSISRPLKFGLRGGEARRSNAVRRAREEQRRERREQRRPGG
jgi:putative FmdB family regulatory protein